MKQRHWHATGAISKTKPSVQKCIPQKWKDQPILKRISKRMDQYFYALWQLKIYVEQRPLVKQSKLILSMLTSIFKYSFSFTYPCPRKLREVMKMSLIEKEPTHVIQNIWKQYHEGRVANTSDTLTSQQYSHFINKANRSPLFIIPLVRNNGHFKLLTQWQDNCFLGTYLEDYKRQGRNAQPYIVFTFFTELLFKKGIVLVRSDIINNSMTKSQALKVWEHLQSSYFEENKYDMVDQFNNRPDQFSMQKYNQIYHLE